VELSVNDAHSIATIFERLDAIPCPECDTELGVAKIEPFKRIQCPACGTKLRVPARLGEYRLLRKLGQGNMGAVYEGHDLTLDRRVAIKVMRANIRDDPDFAQQFIREGRALAALNHPSIAHVYQCSEVKGHPYLVMELVPNGSLNDRISSDEKWAEQEALDTAIAVAQGLEAAAGIKLAHGDLKPDNILFNRKNRPKVVDFGLARFQGEELKTGEIWGTPYYIAPETVRGKQPDAQSDIYCFGATLFHALAGHPPFEGKSANETVLARFRKPVPDLLKERPDLHPATAAVVHRMLEKERLKRYPNYRSLLNDLEQARAELGGPAKDEKKSSSKPWLAVSLSLLVIAAGSALLLVRKDTKSSESKTGHGHVYKIRKGTLQPTAAQTRNPETVTASATPDTPTAFRTKVTTEQGSGADAYIRGKSGSADYARDNYGTEQTFWVKAGRGNDLHLVRKGYLRFDLKHIKPDDLKNARLELTVGKRGNNPKGFSHRLYLWGLQDKDAGETWYDGGGRNPEFKPELNWENAPGNDAEKAQQMSSEAVLLGALDVPGNPSVGEKIVVGPGQPETRRKLIRFLQDDSNGIVTLMLTANTNTRQNAGWRFASSEHPFLDPPTISFE
jgi:serine/threonine protein kinase